MFLRAGDDDGEGAFDPVENQPPGVLDLQRQRRVDDVGRREPEMHPPSFRAELLRDRVDERGRVVVRDALDLRNSLRRGDLHNGANLGNRIGRDGSDLRPRVECGQFDVQPARELALLRPDPGHGRAGVAGNH